MFQCDYSNVRSFVFVAASYFERGQRCKCYACCHRHAMLDWAMQRPTCYLRWPTVIKVPLGNCSHRRFIQAGRVFPGIDRSFVFCSCQGAHVHQDTLGSLP